MSIKITALALKKLNEVPLEVTLWNGNFNKVHCKRTINKNHFDITVRHADESLKDYGVISSVFSDPVQFYYNHCRVNDIPEELRPLIEKMKTMCKMSPEQTEQVRKDMLECFRSFRKEFYGE